MPAGDLDGAYYAHLAQQVADGDVWLLESDSFFGQPAPAFFTSPLYIYVLAFFIKIGGSIDAARFAQVLLGTFAVALVAMTARRWFGAVASWWAGAFAAGFGLFTFYEVLILPASLDPFLTALDLYLLTRALQQSPMEGGVFRPRLWYVGALWWAAAGAALGLHALNRPNMLIVLGGLAVLLIVGRAVRALHRRMDQGKSFSWLGLFAFLAAAVTVILPVTIRNYRATGQVVPIASHGSLNFLIGNGPEADGTFGAVMGIDPSVRGQWIDAPRVAQAALGKNDATQAEVSKFFRDRALGWIREHPGDELRLLGRKTWYALSAGFLTLNHSYPFFARDLGGTLGWLVVGPALIIPLGFIGLVFARPRRDGYWVWAAFVPLAIVSVVVFFVAARYRLPFQVALCVAAGGAAAWAVDRVRAGAWRSVAVAAAATAAIAVIVLWPTRLNDGRGEEQARMGLQEIQSGRVAEGEQWLAKAVARHPFPGVVHLRAGQMYEMGSQPAPALVHYRKAIAIDPAQTSVRFVMGRALYQEKQYEEAVTQLKLAQTGRQADAATRLLVLALSRLGRKDEANVAVRQLDPARWDAETAREFALGLVDVGRVDMSTVAWRRAAEAGNDAKDYERLGLSWAVLGNHPLAIAAFSHAVERDPRSATIRLNYAVAFATVGRLADARREAETALKLNPGYERAREFLRSIAK